MLFTAAALLAPIVALAVAQDTTAAQDKSLTHYTRDTAYPSCPVQPKMEEIPPIQGQVWAPDMTGNMVSDDKVFFLAPGRGACGFNYTDNTAGVCLSPGNVNSRAGSSGCNSLIELTLLSTGITTYGRVLDSCGTDKNSTFGCNDIYVTKVLFTTLANGNETILNAGNLMGKVSWKWLAEDRMPEVNATTPLDMSPLIKVSKASYERTEEYKSTEKYESSSAEAGNDDGNTSKMLGGLLGGNNRRALRRRSLRA